MSSKEFETWKRVYAEHEPFGEWRADLRIGKAFAALLNKFCAVHFKNPKLFKPTDFLVQMERKKKTSAQKPQTWQDMKEMLRAYANAQNAIAQKKKDTLKQNKERFAKVVKDAQAKAKAKVKKKAKQNGRRK